MKISKLENDMLKIAMEIRRFRHGEPVLLGDLRPLLPGMKRNDFDQAVLTMAKNGYFLTKHFHPAQATAAEREAYIPDGKGNYFIAINPRDVEIPKETPKAGPGRGGSRERAGRPAVKQKFQKQQVGRLTGWIVDWLKSQPGKPADIIEAALIEKYGLTPPSE